MTKNSQTTHISNSVGNEVALLMHGVNGYDFSGTGKFLREHLRNERFGIEASVKEDDKLMALLSESHAALINLGDGNFYWSMYSCRGPRDAKKVTDAVVRKLNPSSYDDLIEEESLREDEIGSRVPLTIKASKRLGMFQKALRLPEKRRVISVVYGGMDPARLMHTFELENRFRAAMPSGSKDLPMVFPGMGYTYLGVGKDSGETSALWSHSYPEHDAIYVGAVGKDAKKMIEPVREYLGPKEIRYLQTSD